MHFALVDNVRTPPSPGLKGICPICGSPMIARCGNERIHHWAHKGKLTCDPWWERETLWHRTWKSYFPRNWQEVIQHDAKGEKHIADVRSEHGVTLEFQYSHIHPDERSSRETFYGNMLWVVSGARLQRDLPRFVKGKSAHLVSLENGTYLTEKPENIFPKKWINSTVPVLFDFSDAILPEERERHDGNLLWCLLPGQFLGLYVVLAVSRQGLVNWVTKSATPLHAPSIFADVEKRMKELADQRKRQIRYEQRRALQHELMRQQMRQSRYYGRRKRRF